MDVKNLAYGFVLSFIAGLISCAAWSYIQYAAGLFR